MIKLPKKESATVEFKSTFNEEAVGSLVAFSNAKGGTVYIGVSDKGRVQGVTVGKETLPNWTNEIKLKTTPQIIADAEVFNVNKKTVVALFAPEYPIKPVSVRGRYYKRAGNSNHLLSIDEIANEHLKTINSSWDMYPDPVNTLDDISMPRNKKVADFFKDLGLIEKYGSGIQRIIGYFREEKRPLPEFRNISDGFMVTVFSADRTVEETVEETVEKTVEIILHIIENNPRITQKELAEMTGLTRRGVEWNLSKLKEKGLIVRVGPNKGGYWEVENG